MTLGLKNVSITGDKNNRETEDKKKLKTGLYTDQDGLGER